MKNIVFTLQGITNVGKSQTIKKAYELIIKIYPNSQQEEVINGPNIEIRAIVTINGIKIGIESQGDPNSRLISSLSLFSEKKCHVIICATRTRGATVKAVNNLQPVYEIVWINREKGITDSISQNRSNVKMAKILLSKVQKVIENP